MLHIYLLNLGLIVTLGYLLRTATQGALTEAHKETGKPDQISDDTEGCGPLEDIFHGLQASLLGWTHA